MAMALHGLLLSASLLPAVASAAQVQSEARQYDLPAASLEDALNRFAQEAGITLPFDPALVQGKQAPALHGSYSVLGGLNALLAGSGLTASRTESGNWLLQPREQTGALELNTLSISGKAPGSTTEGSGSYTTYSSSSSTRLNLTPKETPQSLTVITRQRLDDQKLANLTDVMDATPGIIVNHVSVGAENNTYWSRGFQINNFEIDGIPTSSRLDNTTQATAMYDRVEIIRGATGLISGTGTPSATINMIRKRPTYDPQFAINAEAGTWDRYGVGFDASGPLNDAGSIRGRLVVDYKDQNSWVDRLTQESQLIYAISEFDLDDSTLLTVGFSYLNKHNDSPIRAGFPAYFSNGVKTDFSRSTNTAPDWAYNDTKQTNLFTSLEHQFANGWSGKLELSHSENQFDQITNYMNGSIDQQTGAGSYMYPNRWSGTPRQDAFDGYLTGPFSLFGREHELITGLTLSRYRENTPNHGGWVGPWTGYDGTIDNFYTWDGTGPRPDFTTVGKTYIKENQYAAFLTARFHLNDDASLILGSRVTDWKRDNTEETFGQTPTRNVENRHGVFLPYAGLVYDLNQTWSVYGSYTQIFNPQAYGIKDVNNKPLLPQEGVGYEIGVKGSFNDDRLTASMALFRIEQDNLAVYVGAPDIYRAEQGTTSEGLELEFNGQFSDNWQGSVGYAYNVSTDQDDERIATNIPRHSLKTFTSYRLSGVLDKVTVGGGVNWQSKIGQDLHTYTQGSYALVNLMARYEITSNLTASANLNNVFDRKYAAYADTWIVYGAPRNLMTSLEYRF
ncbi:TonB-dependent siderophore receptor [Pseudomonas sp. LRF_L74]|uniref:TonB-dependent siderophore receptor n=1 Tax=Pseudomonas sp. LRF_L74 TaxID=3369422 RepID=UPI003F60E25B